PGRGRARARAGAPAGARGAKHSRGWGELVEGGGRESGRAPPPPTGKMPGRRASPPATRSRGNASRTMPNASGKIAPPRPWIVRATIITASEWVTAASSEPAARPTSVTTKTGFFPYMSPSRPAIGVTTEAARRYAVKTQATPVVVVWRSPWSTGSAGTTSDWRSAYAAPASERTARSRPGRPKGGGGASGTGAPYQKRNGRST